jgi:hypothetical protein
LLAAERRERKSGLIRGNRVGMDVDDVHRVYPEREGTTGALAV